MPTATVTHESVYEALPIRIMNNVASVDNRINNNSASHDNAVNQVTIGLLGAIANKVVNIDTAEAAGISRIHRSPAGESFSDAAQVISLARMLLDTAKATKTD